LKRGGTLVSVVSPPDQTAAERQGVRAMFFLVSAATSHLARIAAMVEAGDLVTNIGTVLPLAEVWTAHEVLEGSRPRPRGKIVFGIGA
jgi:NADPH:quinone reductase-like Zn-dependent oxidoreductase